MAISATDLIRAKLQGIKSILAAAPAKQKTELISRHLGDDFNEVLKMVRAAHADIGEALPKDATARSGVARQLQKCDATYLDIEAFCEQILNLLRLTEGP